MPRDPLATVIPLRHAHAMLLDRALPKCHEVSLRHTVVNVPPAATSAAIRTADLRAAPLPRLLLRARSLPERTAQRRGGLTPAPTAFTSLRAALDTGTPWMLLGEIPDSEIVAGAIGALWRPVIEWAGFEPSEFSQFREPGFAKVAAGFSVRHYGTDRSLLSLELRAPATSPAARSALRRYWRLSSPFISLIARGVVSSMRNHAEVHGPLAAPAA